MAQILINHLERVGGTSIKEIVIGKKSLKTIQTIPKFQTKSDVVLFQRNLDYVPGFDGAAFDLWATPTINSSINLDEGQRRLDDIVAHAVTPERKMLDERVLFIDPNTEWYRYRYPLDGGTRQSAIMNQREFPHAIREIFERRGTDGHNAAWKEMSRRKLTLSFVSWHIDQALKYGASLVIPPAPLIDGRSLTMLDIAWEINRLTRTLAFETTDAFWSLYIPVHSDAFRDEIRCKRILDVIRQNAIPDTLLVLKFFRTKNILDDSSSRARMSRFLCALDQMKSSLEDRMALMVLDTKSEGFAFMANGVDFTCDPLGGVKDTLQFAKTRERDDTGDEDDTRDRRLRHYGKYFHPDTRDFMSISDLMDVVKPDGLLPHDCMFCGKLHGRLVDGKKLPKRDEWNALRRLHNFMCRKEEDKWLGDAVNEGNPRAAELYLARPERGNKNLVDFLPLASLETSKSIILEETRWI